MFLKFISRLGLHPAFISAVQQCIRSISAASHSQMRANKGNKHGRPAFAGPDFRDERAADAKQMRFTPTHGLAMVHVGSPQMVPALRTAADSETPFCTL